MKRKKILTLVVTALSTATLLTVILAAQKLGESKDVVLTIKSDKDRIYLGEVLTLEFELLNKGTTTVRVPVNGVRGGYIEVFVSKKGKNFRKYFRSDWGRVDGEVEIFPLEPGQRRDVERSGASILWNGKPDYSHLNPQAGLQADKQDNRILTDYAFPDAGVYLVKATSCLFDEFNRCSNSVESEPIEIVVNEPVGDDLEVWEKIKGNRHIALLMQSGSFYLSDETNKQEIISKLEQILINYPDSIYSAYVRPKLEKYKADEVRRKEMLEKATIRKN